jgi:hypothetical protein
MQKWSLKTKRQRHKEVLLIIRNMLPSRHACALLWATSTVRVSGRVWQLRRERRFKKNVALGGFKIETAAGKLVMWQLRDIVLTPLEYPSQ